jgi:hypothetical protein
MWRTRLLGSSYQCERIVRRTGLRLALKKAADAVENIVETPTARLIFHEPSLAT